RPTSPRPRRPSPPSTSPPDPTSPLPLGEGHGEGVRGPSATLRAVVKLGMIGVGGWGTAGHLQAYRESPHAEVVALCDAIPERAAEVAADWGVARHYADYRELLADPEVEAVDVATPNNTHREIALAAL